MWRPCLQHKPCKALHVPCWKLVIIPHCLRTESRLPAGCTIDGILELEDGKVRVTLIKAVVKATERAKELMFERPERRFPVCLIAAVALVAICRVC